MREKQKLKQAEAGTPGWQFTNDVYEIHGNIMYMRCFRECHPTIYKIPPKESLETEFPKCSKCGDNMRPNVLWFDESYNEKNYRKETVKNFSDDVDAIVVIGTTLETNLASMLVMNALERD